MTDFGCCVKCGDNCLLTAEVQKDGKKEVVVTCVKRCSRANRDVCCESCLETFNKGKRIKSGEMVK